MSKELVIVFVKNSKLGHVKTRLANTIGHEAALQVYNELVMTTEIATHTINTPIHVYYSDHIDNTYWKNAFKTVQQGKDLGERMKEAFLKGFKDGFERIVLIGSDLPDITANHIFKGLEILRQSEVVFGPAEDGGYYLIGLSKMYSCIFDNKPWSKQNLLNTTLKELKANKVSVELLETLNDIDTYEDLLTSTFYKNNKSLQLKINQLYD